MSCHGQNVPHPWCSLITKQYLCLVVHGNHRQWTNCQSQLSKFMEEFFLPEQAKSEINNKTYLFAIADTKSIAFLAYYSYMGTEHYISRSDLHVSYM